MRETNIVQSIRLECSDIALLFRNNVGALKDARGRLVTYGLHKGSPDLVGIRRSDGRFIGLECKVPGKNATPEQLNFLRAIRDNHGIAGVAHSVEEARNIILGNT